MRTVRDIHNQGRWIHRAVKAIFALTGVFFIAWLVLVGVVAYKAATLAGEADWSNGLRGVVERLWCGSSGCLDR